MKTLYTILIPLCCCILWSSCSPNESRPSNEATEELTGTENADTATLRNPASHNTAVEHVNYVLDMDLYDPEPDVFLYSRIGPMHCNIREVALDNITSDSIHLTSIRQKLLQSNPAPEAEHLRFRQLLEYTTPHAQKLVCVFSHSPDAWEYNMLYICDSLTGDGILYDHLIQGFTPFQINDFFNDGRLLLANVVNDTLRFYATGSSLVNGKMREVDAVPLESKPIEDSNFYLYLLPDRFTDK